jgi:hypothetical protein
MNSLLHKKQLGAVAKASQWDARDLEMGFSSTFYAWLLSPCIIS